MGQWQGGGGQEAAGARKEEDLKGRKVTAESEAMSPPPAEALTCKGRRRKDSPLRSGPWFSASLCVIFWLNGFSTVSQMPASPNPRSTTTRRNRTQKMCLQLTESSNYLGASPVAQTVKNLPAVQ